MDENIGLLEFAQAEISREMLELNKQITQINIQLRRCQISKS